MLCVTVLTVISRRKTALSVPSVLSVLSCAFRAFRAFPAFRLSVLSRAFRAFRTPAFRSSVRLFVLRPLHDARVLPWFGRGEGTAFVRAENFVETAQRLLPEREIFVEAAQRLLPERKNFVEAAQRLLPERKNFVEAAQRLLPERKNFVEAAQRLLPEWEESFCVGERRIPRQRRRTRFRKVGWGKAVWEHRKQWRWRIQTKGSRRNHGRYLCDRGIDD